MPLGPDCGPPPRSTLPAGATVLPEIVNTDTVPALRSATSARLPARLMATPAAPIPASRTPITFGGRVVRSITDMRLSGTVLVGSPGASFVADVTSASDASGVIATESGGPTTLVGAFTSAMTVGGLVLRSMTVTVSGVGFGGTWFTPLTSWALWSFADTAIWAAAGTASAAARQPAAMATGRIFFSCLGWFVGRGGFYAVARITRPPAAPTRGAAPRRAGRAARRRRSRARARGRASSGRPGSW